MCIRDRECICWRKILKRFTYAGEEPDWRQRLQLRVRRLLGACPFGQGSMGITSSSREYVNHSLNGQPVIFVCKFTCYRLKKAAGFWGVQDVVCARRHGFAPYSLR